MTTNDRVEHKTVLITGSTDGVGRRVAERLAEPGITLLVHGRDHGKAERLLAEIHKAGAVGIFYPADFSSLAEVRRLADEVRRNHHRLDLLINNAGIGTGGPGSGRRISSDGSELRFAVNYLAAFLLTRLLLPVLTASRPARIVNVASVGQQPLDFSDIMLTHRYSGRRAYCQSKLAEIMFTFDLAEELEGSGVTVNCLHPATYMDTAMVRADGITPLNTVDKGAEAILNLAVSPAQEGKTGLYFDGLQPSRANTQAYDVKARERLKALSLQLAQL